VLDLGGRIGLFGVFARERWDVTAIRSYEPDPRNREMLRATPAPFAEWEVTAAAVSNSEGVAHFAAGLSSESRVTGDGADTITVPIVDFFAQPSADLVKIDIEGSEWPILTDPRLAEISARVIVMEWHALGCPEQDAAACARRLLHAAGFTGQHHDAPRKGNGLLWAWRTS